MKILRSIPSQSSQGPQLRDQGRSKRLDTVCIWRSIKLFKIAMPYSYGRSSLQLWYDFHHEILFKI